MLRCGTAVPHAHRRHHRRHLRPQDFPRLASQHIAARFLPCAARSGGGQAARPAPHGGGKVRMLQACILIQTQTGKAAAVAAAIAASTVSPRCPL